MYPRRIIFLGYATLYIIILATFSCTNDPEKVKALNKGKSLPVEWAEGVVIHYSDKGELRALIKAPRVDKFLDEENNYNEMPLGIDAVFYDSAGAEMSGLRANYAIEYPAKKLVETRNNVRVINEQGDTLYTEHLIWDRNKELIYTETSVKILTHDGEVVFGENGMEADERFTKWRIKTISKSSLIIRENENNQ